MIKSFAHDAVDAVQKGKLQFVTLFVKHDAMADAMEQFVEAQSKYTKSVLDTNIDAMLNLGMAMTKKEFVTELASAYGLDKFVPTAPTKAASKKAK